MFGFHLAMRLRLVESHPPCKNIGKALPNTCTTNPNALLYTIYIYVKPIHYSVLYSFYLYQFITSKYYPFYSSLIFNEDSDYILSLITCPHLLFQIVVADM